MPVEVTGEKYTRRNDDVVRPRPWSPKSVDIEARTRVRRSCGERWVGEGQEKRTVEEVVVEEREVVGG
jgi:hypothetical protein